jgi:hypothetical protein
MKKFLSILMIAFIASFTVTSCGSSEGGDVAETPVYNSEYFADVVSSNEGDFIGLNLGDSRETVKGKLPEEAFDDETDSYLYYYWEFGEHQYYLDLYFDEMGNLNSIDGYLYFYDADYNYDEVAAKAFYTDMKDLFVSKYGSEEEYADEDFTYISWYLDDMDAEVGLDGGEVYWYIYHYEEYDM